MLSVEVTEAKFMLEANDVLKRSHELELIEAVMLLKSGAEMTEGEQNRKVVANEEIELDANDETAKVT